MNSHLSTPAVSDRLKPPLSENIGQIYISFTRCCIEWGLHARLVSQSAVSFYLTFSPLPKKFSAVLFCCTFLRVASTGNCPALCPAMPGLSSYTAFRLASAAIRITHILKTLLHFCYFRFLKLLYQIFPLSFFQTIRIR